VSIIGGPRMNICEPAIRRPVGTTLLAIGLMLATGKK
jgi:hypothetical protein